MLGANKYVKQQPQRPKNGQLRARIQELEATVSKLLEDKRKLADHIDNRQKSAAEVLSGLSGAPRPLDVS